MTASGIYGFITGFEDDTVWVEIDDDVQIRVNRGFVQGKVDTSGTAAHSLPSTGAKTADASTSAGRPIRAAEARGRATPPRTTNDPSPPVGVAARLRRHHRRPARAQPRLRATRPVLGLDLQGGVSVVLAPDRGAPQRRPARHPRPDPRRAREPRHRRARRPRRGVEHRRRPARREGPARRARRRRRRRHRHAAPGAQPASPTGASTTAYQPCHRASSVPGDDGPRPGPTTTAGGDGRRRRPPPPRDDHAAAPAAGGRRTGVAQRPGRRRRPPSRDAADDDDASPAPTTTAARSPAPPSPRRRPHDRARRPSRRPPCCAARRRPLPRRPGRRRRRARSSSRNSAGVELAQQRGWTVVVGLSPAARRRGTPSPRECYNGAPTCPSRQLAIVLDDVVQSAPTVQRADVHAAASSITGSFKEGEARSLARVLNRGAFPANVEAQTCRHRVADARRGLAAGVDLRRPRRHRPAADRCSCSSTGG